MGGLRGEADSLDLREKRGESMSDATMKPEATIYRVV
jgi:hypothetical protein